VKRTSWIVLIILLVSAAAIGGYALARGQLRTTWSDDPTSVKVKVKLKDTSRNPLLIRQEDGSFLYIVEYDDGHIEQLTPQAFSQRLYEEAVSRNFAWRVMNITTPLGIIWIGIGLLGQVLFTGRMVVQWLISEKKRRSVVPVAFWWMSLIGATLLLCYFLWRKDVVGVLGQATGWFIYVRNLWLIYGRQVRRRTGKTRANNGQTHAIAAQSDVVQTD
jgi:lipid-A-disaccharide synthase-like uncharacterized protein